ncbi:hypothetical protein [Paenibacillus sp. R14(2021)]|nr:hypothetical protein [Paenibacillus sp. R14(2021)]
MDGLRIDPDTRKVYVHSLPVFEVGHQREADGFLDHAVCCRRLQPL